MTESLVLSWPSTLMQLKESSTLWRIIVGASFGVSPASVMMTHSMVAMFGEIIAAPLQAPLIRTVLPPIVIDCVACLGNVSVVIIARAASRNDSAEDDSLPAATGIPACSVSIGRNRPMTPVEATSTSSGWAPICSATRGHSLCASAIPRSPVAALELPELITMARAVDRGSRSRETLTGAPQTRFVVNTPAAEHGRSEANNARSSFWGFRLDPALNTRRSKKPTGNGIRSVIFATRFLLRCVMLDIRENEVRAMGQPRT